MNCSVLKDGAYNSEPVWRGLTLVNLFPLWIIASGWQSKSLNSNVEIMHDEWSNFFKSVDFHFGIFQVEHNDPDNKSLLRFGALWQSEFNHDSLLVYSTGRSPTMFSDLRREVPLLTPGIAILSVGTEIYYGDTMTQDLGWVDELNKGWSRPAIEEVAKEMNLKYQVQILTH